MEQEKIGVGTVARGDMTRRSAYGRSVRRVCDSVLGLGLVGALIAEGKCVAQAPFPELAPMPLAVRPHEMATGTSTPSAGKYPLDSLEDYLVYVPEQCVGTRRCPLVVFLHPGAEDSRYVVQRWSPVSDKYGTILLAPTMVPGGWDSTDQRNVSAAMEQVLRKFAIDPDRIALIGYSGSGPTAISFGIYSADVFSRIIAVSTDSLATGLDPRNKTMEVLLVSGRDESRSHFNDLQGLRQAGHPVKQVIALREHSMEKEHYEFLGHWLQESWAIPNPAARPAPSVVTDSVPLLTTDVLTRMTAFWTRFQQEPDSIRTTARQAFLREVVLPIANERPSVVMVDMPALAAKYPSVAADLEAAGLTAQQHEAYRVALISARVANFAVHGPVAGGPASDWISVEGQPVRLPGLGAQLDEINRLRSSGKSPVTIEATSAQGKNLEFTITHEKEFGALAKTGMWDTP